MELQEIREALKAMYGGENRQITDGKDYPDSQNLGLLDQVKALKWVHENIAAFGSELLAPVPRKRRKNSAYRYL